MTFVYKNHMLVCFSFLYYNIWLYVHFKIYYSVLFQQHNVVSTQLLLCANLPFPKKCCISSWRIIHVIQLVCLMLIIGSPEELPGVGGLIYLQIIY